MLSVHTFLNWSNICRNTSCSHGIGWMAVLMVSCCALVFDDVDEAVQSITI